MFKFALPACCISSLSDYIIANLSVERADQQWWTIQELNLKTGMLQKVKFRHPVEE